MKDNMKNKAGNVRCDLCNMDFSSAEEARTHKEQQHKNK